MRYVRNIKKIVEADYFLLFNRDDHLLAGLSGTILICSLSISLKISS